MLHEFVGSMRRAAKRERALRRYRQMMRDPQRYTYKARAEVYRELAAYTDIDESLRQQWLLWADNCEALSAQHDE